MAVTIRALEGAREPQWLWIEYTLRRNGEAKKGGATTAEAYLCGSVPVQNSLLALRPLAAEVSSQGIAAGGTGEGDATKGPGKETSGDGIFRPAWYASHRP